MTGLRSILPLSRDSMRGVTVKTVIGEPPTQEYADPRDLFVEENYQRDVGERGTRMIRGIVGDFSWHMFKAPICFRSPEHGDVLVVVDGQHSAIAAATRGIRSIPILVFSGATSEERARAFVGHNYNRVALTMQAIHHAQIAAGDATANAMEQACREAGAKILSSPVNLAVARPVGETIAVGTIRAILRKHGPEHLTRTMRVLVAAGRGPIKAQEISAASAILISPARIEDIDERLAAVVRSKTAKAWAQIAAAESDTLPQALATCWLRALNARAGRAAPIPPHARPVMTSKKVALATANGVSVFTHGSVARQGWCTVEVGEKGAMLVARLVSVMPAQIGFDRLAEKIFSGQAGARQKLDDLVAAVNPELKRAGLEIFHVKASGYMIREMANSGENLLRA